MLYIVLFFKKEMRLPRSLRSLAMTFSSISTCMSI